MKIRRCSIYQFGKLKEQDFEFSEGITLIQGANESGKTTLHTALAALLFGVERSRGRGAARDVFRANQPWSQPELYGGAIEWEREDRLIRTERDFSKLPPRAYSTETLAGRTRDLKEGEQPLPESLSPYLFYNTLSFKQSGSDVESGMADELRSHIINLQGSGNESMDVAAALGNLKARRRALTKDLKEEAAAEAAVLDREIHQLEQAGFASETDWEEARESLKDQEALARDLDAAHQADLRLLARKKSVLSRLDVQDREKLTADRDKARILRDQFEVYQRDYAADSFSPFWASVLSWLSLGVMILCLWTLLNGIQLHRFFQAAAAGLVLIGASFISLRFSRKQDARAGHKHNKKVLNSLLERYVKDYTPRGDLQEARELADYLDRLCSLESDIRQEEQQLETRQEVLQNSLDLRADLSRRLEQELSLRLEREQWEARIRALKDKREQLEPVLLNNQEIRRELAALDLAYNTLSALATGVYSDFGAPLTAEASRIFSQISGGRYEGVRINDKLEIWAIQNHQPVAPDALSGGTMAQLYFAFRLAIIRLLWPEEPMPLFFDDAFVYYDRERLASLLAWLRDNYAGQVFIFTCQDREEELMREGGIPFRKIALSMDYE